MLAFPGCARKASRPLGLGVGYMSEEGLPAVAPSLDQIRELLANATMPDVGIETVESLLRCWRMCVRGRRKSSKWDERILCQTSAAMTCNFPGTCRRKWCVSGRATSCVKYLLTEAGEFQPCYPLEMLWRTPVSERYKIASAKLTLLTKYPGFRRKRLRGLTSKSEFSTRLKAVLDKPVW